MIHDLLIFIGGAAFAFAFLYGAAWLDRFETSRDFCMCFAFDADTGEYGWRPCPMQLCERKDHQHPLSTRREREEVIEEFDRRERKPSEGEHAAGRTHEAEIEPGTELSGGPCSDGPPDLRLIEGGE